MSKEKLAKYLAQIFPQTAKTQEADKVVVHEPNPSPVSPWKVVMGESQRDRALTSIIDSSFNPKFPGASDLYPLADAGGRWLSEPRENESGDKVSSIWLNPEVWQPTLDEFAHFADYFNHKISFLVNWDNSESHPAFTQRGYISVTPVLVDRQGFGKSGDITFGISNEGRICVGSIEIGFNDLGYLNPHRENKAARSRLLETLSQK